MTRLVPLCCVAIATKPSIFFCFEKKDVPAAATSRKRDSLRPCNPPHEWRERKSSSLSLTLTRVSENPCSSAKSAFCSSSPSLPVLSNFALMLLLLFIS
ncbi:hypothetical protein CR513_37204, partial [Mucuna pruriens]